MKFRKRIPVRSPRVLARTKDSTPSDPNFYSATLSGSYYRVIPETEKEVLYLQGLSKNYDTHAPSQGDGIIVRSECIERVAGFVG